MQLCKALALSLTLNYLNLKSNVLNYLNLNSYVLHEPRFTKYASRMPPPAEDIGSEPGMTIRGVLQQQQKITDGLTYCHDPTRTY